MSASTTTSSPKPAAWWHFQPMRYSALECLIMRAAFALLLFASIKWETSPYREQRNPTGLAHFCDLTWLAEHPPGLLVQGIVVFSLALYVAGRFTALGLFPAVGSAVVIGALVTSKAMHHSWQLVTLIGLAQFIVYLWPSKLRWHRLGITVVLAGLLAVALFEARGITVTKTGFAGAMSWLGRFANTLIRDGLLAALTVWGLGALSQWKQANPSPLAKASPALHELAVRVSAAVFAASYVVCGVMKLVNSDFRWIGKVPLLAVQLLKSNWSAYYDEVAAPQVAGTLMPPTVSAWMNDAVQAIVDYPNVARLFFGSGLLIELGAFVVLINRRWAVLGALTIIAMHLSISLVMQLDFDYHIWATVIFILNVPGLVMAWKSRRGLA